MTMLTFAPSSTIYAHTPCLPPLPAILTCIQLCSLPHLLIPDSNQRQVAKKGYKRNTRLWQTPFPAPKPETMQRRWSRREVTVISQNIPLFFHWGKWGLPCSSPYCIEGLRDGGWETDPSRSYTFNPARNIHTLWTFGTISLSDGYPNGAHSCHPGTNSL